MDAVAERFIELVAIQHYRPLTETERKELIESYQWLVNVVAERWWLIRREMWNGITRYAPSWSDLKGGEYRGKA